MAQMKKKLSTFGPEWAPNHLKQIPEQQEVSNNSAVSPEQQKTGVHFLPFTNCHKPPKIVPQICGSSSQFFSPQT